MEQPKGFVIAGQELLVYRLKKSLYGLKQASRKWYKKFDNFIQSVGFFKSIEDHHLFSKTAQDGSSIFLILYVDDMLLSTCHVGELANLVRQLRSKFSMKNLILERHVSGMKISRLRNRQQLFLSQSNYIDRVLECFNMQLAKSVVTLLPVRLLLSQGDCSTSGSEGEDTKSVPYAPIVGPLIYAVVTT